MNIVELGTLTKARAVYDDERNELTPPTYYDGYHVDTTALIEGADDKRVEPQPNHHHEFAGVETYHYRFTDKNEWAQCDPRSVDDDSTGI